MGIKKDTQERGERLGRLTVDTKGMGIKKDTREQGGASTEVIGIKKDTRERRGSP